jgi:hypothetical protein
VEPPVGASGTQGRSDHPKNSTFSRNVVPYMEQMSCTSAMRPLLLVMFP